MKKFFRKFILLFLSVFCFASVFAQLRINEVLPNPLPDPLSAEYQSLLNCNNTAFGHEWIEIFNLSKCDTVYLDCYIIAITNSATNFGSFAFPPGARVGPLEHLVIGGPEAPNVDFIMNDYCATNDVCGNYLALGNSAGYAAIYDNSGNVVDAVYWTDAPGQPGDLIFNPVFDNIPCVPQRCVNANNLKKPSEMVPGQEISYAGEKPDPGLTLHRATDGSGGWQGNATPTPGNCNGICITPSDLAVLPDSVGNETCRLSNGYIFTITSGGTPPYDYRWNNEAFQEDLTGLIAGNYSVTVTDFQNCKNVLDLTLLNLGEPVEVEIVPPATTIYQGDSAFLSVVSASSLYYWEWKPTLRLTCPLCSETYVYPQESKTYTVKVIDVDSCIAETSIFVKVLPDDKSVFVPNIFTPNKDGLNEGLYVRSMRIATMDFRIFDRWGKEVFYTNDQNTPWTGKDKGGNDLPDGVYVYLLEAVFNNGKDRVFRGNITMIR